MRESTRQYLISKASLHGFDISNIENACKFPWLYVVKVWNARNSKKSLSIKNLLKMKLLIFLLLFVS